MLLITLSSFLAVHTHGIMPLEEDADGCPWQRALGNTLRLCPLCKTWRAVHPPFFREAKEVVCHFSDNGHRREFVSIFL